MKFLTGDETGICKWVRVESQKIERFGAQRLRDGVQQLCWAGPSDNRESRVVVGYESGCLEARSSTDGSVLSSMSMAPNVRRIEAFEDRLLAVSACGSSAIVEGWCGDELPSDEGGSAHNFQLPAPIADAKLDPCGRSRLAFGGGENDVKLWDLDRGDVVWRAKNVREDHLCLRVPVKVSSLQWATGCAPSRGLLIAGTKDGKLRLYDVNAQRRPLFELQIGFQVGGGSGGYTGTADDMPRPMMCSAVTQVRGKDWSFFCGNTMGVLREYDLRNLPSCKAAEIPPGRKSHLKLAARTLPFKRGYRGITGSIRAVDVHATGEALVAVGLGRFAYIFETRKRRMVSKVYLKQKLCAVLMSSEERQAPKGEASEDEDEEAEAEQGAEGAEGAQEPHVAEDKIVEGFSDDEGEADKAGAAQAPRKRKKRKQAAADADAPEGDEEPDASKPRKKKIKKKASKS